MRIPVLLRTWIERFRKPVPLGLRGERYAERYLKRQGYLILARGSRSRFGEIDLIAVDGRTVVFVEVKTRRGDWAGPPEESVDGRKQARITKAAWSYIRRHHLFDYPMRFDVVAIEWPDKARRPAEVRHLRAAFEAVDLGDAFV